MKFVVKMGYSDICFAFYEHCNLYFLFCLIFSFSLHLNVTFNSNTIVLCTIVDLNALGVHTMHSVNRLYSLVKVVEM